MLMNLLYKQTHAHEYVYTVSTNTYTNPNPLYMTIHKLYGHTLTWPIEKPNEISNIISIVKVSNNKPYICVLW